MTVRIPVHPDNYFYDHANGNRVAFSADMTTVRVPGMIEKWIGYSQRDFTGQRKSKIDIASLALEFGAEMPLVEWGMPVGRFNEIIREVLKEEMEQVHSPGIGMGPMNTDHEPQLGPKINVRIDDNTREMLNLYQDLLRTHQSSVIRHCMALSFHWYDQEVVSGDKAKGWNEHTQQYVDRFRGELEARIDYAENQLGLDL